MPHTFIPKIREARKALGRFVWKEEEWVVCKFRQSLSQNDLLKLCCVPLIYQLSTENSGFAYPFSNSFSFWLELGLGLICAPLLQKQRFSWCYSHFLLSFLCETSSNFVVESIFLFRFETVDNIPKMMARLGQCFTQSRLSGVNLQRENCLIISDVIGGQNSKGFVNSEEEFEGVSTILSELPTHSAMELVRSVLHSRGKSRNSCGSAEEFPAATRYASIAWFWIPVKKAGGKCASREKNSIANDLLLETKYEERVLSPFSLSLKMRVFMIFVHLAILFLLFTLCFIALP